ncbi:MAG TPA: pyridoxal-phosphate dependent enzyme [Myxococcota bacterium]|nr:pyridoxal-phosphate dependent enzyme [Myxococcota bacterium]
MANELDLSAVRSARERIARFVLRTPVLRIRPRPDLDLYLKAESLQPTGAFKLRGAFSLMTTLSRDCPGVVAHSSGNHAQAVARAARVLGLRAVLVMPEDAPALKRERAAADGAAIELVGSDSDLRARRAAELAARDGLVPVPPFDHPLVAAGQGTAALELLEEVESLDSFWAPVSGGGLLAGCAVALHGLVPGLELVAVEPEDANDFALSLAAGERRKIPPPRTIADGLRVRTPGEITWPVLQRHVSRALLVSDPEMLAAMAFALRELRLVLEPSGAAALAAVLREGRGRCGVLLSGGNIEPELLARALALRAE